MPTRSLAPLRLLAVACVAAACVDAPTAPRASTGPSAAPAPALAETPWLTHLTPHAVITYRVRGEHLGYANVPVTVDYDITSRTADPIVCGLYNQNYILRAALPTCQGSVTVTTPTWPAYVVGSQSESGWHWELTGLPAAGPRSGDIYLGANLFSYTSTLPYRVVDVAQRTAPEKVKGRDPNKKATRAERKDFKRDCGNGRMMGCLAYTVFSPGNVTRADYHGSLVPVTVTIDWGDGTPADTLSMATYAAATARHEYAARGTYTVRVGAASFANPGPRYELVRTGASTTVVID